MSANIDPITGLPDLTSDVYQIPLNTDSLPYKDLQAEARLPRQPLLPDDIIPTVALLTGLRSDNTGEVVHTDDDHAAKVYVVNWPPSSGGGGGSAASPNVVPYDFSMTSFGWQAHHIGNLGAIGTVIYGVRFAYTLDMGSILEKPINGAARLYIPTAAFNSSELVLATIAISSPQSGDTVRFAGEVNETWVNGITFTDALDEGDGLYHVYIQDAADIGASCQINIWAS